MAKPKRDSAFVALPQRCGLGVRLLGPPPAEAMVAVDPVTRIDEPLTVVQSCIAGVCDAAGRLIQPLEIQLIADPAAVVPDKQVPTAAVLACLDRLPALRRQMPLATAFEYVRHLAEPGARLGPLIFCRRARRLFVARSPTTYEALTRFDQPGGEQPPDAGTTARAGATPDAEQPAQLISWDSPHDLDRQPMLYGAFGGQTPAGPIASLEQLLLDQGKVVAEALRLQQEDPVEALRRGAAEWCCQCEECQKLDDPDAEYKYALDRLAIVSAAEVPVDLMPLGAWTWLEAARIISGQSPSDVLGAAAADEDDWTRWRRSQAEQMASCAPPRLLAGETDGRELLEVTRVTLGLVADVLVQLDAAWRLTSRPHLCWNEHTVRACWQPPSQVPGMVWGFVPVLRKVGLQPDATLATPDDRPLAYPPAFTTPTLLAEEMLDASRYFDEPRTAAVFVKAGQGGGERQEITVLVEELGIAWELLCPDDVLHITGAGWKVVVSPLAERDPNDGEGLPMAGYAEDQPLKVGEEYKDCQVRWYPRFGQATDLHALGVLLLEALLATDERSGEAFRAALAAEREDLARSCQALPVEQREGFAKTWVAQRSDVDAPAALWSRRNLLYPRDARAATRLDAFPPPLWQATLVWCLRLITNIEGFSYCADRAQPAPRVGDVLLPLIELRGLIALLDDHLFTRTQPGDDVLSALDAEA